MKIQNFSLIFRGCQSIIGDVEKITRRSFVTHARPAPPAVAKPLWLNRKSAGHPSSFMPLLLFSLHRGAPKAALRIIGVLRLPNTLAHPRDTIDSWDDTTTISPWHAPRTARSAVNQRAKPLDRRANLSSPIILLRYRRCRGDRARSTGSRTRTDLSWDPGRGLKIRAVYRGVLPSKSWSCLGAPFATPPSYCVANN